MSLASTSVRLVYWVATRATDYHADAGGGNVTYDIEGRLVTKSYADSTQYTYDDLGRRTAVDGARTYPLRYEYDVLGRMTALVDGEGNRTEWSYDSPGRLTRKTYADGTHYDYTYDTLGRLLSRTDAMGKTTAYAYNASGQITAVDYPDDTDILTTYDSLGRIASRTDSAGTWQWTYYGDTGRELTVADPDGNVVSYAYDATGQRTAMILAVAGQQVMELDYTYTDARLTGIASSTDMGGAARTSDYTYAYLAGANLVESVTSSNGASDILSVARTYDDAGRLLSIASAAGPAPQAQVASFTYGLDALGRRISRTDLDGSRIDYSYNRRDELIGAVRSTYPAATPFGSYPYIYAYDFDRIGNHLSQIRNGTEFRGRYNTLNELTEREVAGAVRVQGAADGVLPIGVKVDGRDAETQDVDADTAAFRGDSPIRDRQTGEKAISIVATDSNDPPKRTEAVRTVRLPDSNPIDYTYDANGNMTGDGYRSLTWNNENRLVALESTVAIPAADRRRVEFTYDGQGRRRWRKTYAWDEQTQDWSLEETATFVYDGWNIIYESTTDHTQTPAVTAVDSYVWGLDLSQTLQGAGGVGGLLSVTHHTTPDTCCHVVYDGNGNVVALIDADSGAVSAEYDYSPFGKTVKSTGAEAEANPFRFSTKYSEAAVGSELYYYGLRFYTPELGRWVNRDPIGEEGGQNLLGFVGNSTPGLTDGVGLRYRGDGCSCGGTKCGIKSPPKITSVDRATVDGEKYARLKFEASFEEGGEFSAGCCAVRWMVKFQGAVPLHPPHIGFTDDPLTGDFWYEDRDENGNRYGHRSDDASDLGNGDRYSRYGRWHDPHCGDVYKGQDTTGRPSDVSSISVSTFKLVVVDICSENSDPPVVAESGEEAIRWYRDPFPTLRPGTGRGME